ncbi:Os04g0166300, partial [Oryza sativa Japonica Group]
NFPLPIRRSLAQKQRPRAGAAVPPPPVRRATTGTLPPARRISPSPLSPPLILLGFPFSSSRVFASVRSHLSHRRHRNAAVTQRRLGSTGAQHRRRTGGRSKVARRTGGGGVEAQIQVLGINK